MIRVTSLGPSALLGAAILPVPASIGQAYQARGFIHGNPRQRIPAPYPAAVPQERTGLAIGGHDSRSSDSPGYWATSIYYLYGPQAATPPVSVVSDNQMPVPAKDPRGIPITAENGGGVGQSPRPASKRPTFLDGRQVMQPAVAVRFPNRRARSG